MAITRTDVIGVIGDSITYGFGLSDGWTFNFMRAVAAKYTRPSFPARPSGLAPIPQRMVSGPTPVPARISTGYQAQRSPTFFIDGVPGRKVGDISGTMTTILAPFIAGRTTVYIVELGTNDCGVTAAATFIAQATAIRDAILAASGCRMLVWVGPWCNGGENWPDGSNPVDLTVDGIKDKNDELSALMAADPRCYFISWRQLRLDTVNATTNPAHLTQGIYTLDGTHPTTTPTATTTVSGGDLLANWTASNLTFA